MELYENDDYREYIKKYGFEQFCKLRLKVVEIQKHPISIYLSRYNIGDNEIKLFSELITNIDKFQLLTILFLDINNISEKGAKFIAELLIILPCLTTLDLSFNNICSKGAEYIAESLKINKILINLNLSYNNIGNKGAEYIIKSITEICGLQILSLTGNNIDYQGIKSIELLKKCKIKSLYLNNNNIGNEGAKFIGNLLENNKYLEVLDLCNIGINDGIEFITKSLSTVSNTRNRTYLTKLSLYGNDISGKRLKFITELLETNKNLLKLYLWKVNVDDDETKIIIKSLKCNKSLIEFCLSGDDIDDNDQNDIDELLKSNKINKERISNERALEKIYLSRCLKYQFRSEFLELFNTFAEYEYL